MQRRDFLRLGVAASSASLVSGSVGLLSWSPRAQASTVTVAMNAVAGNVAMVDGTQARMLTFSTGTTPEFPGSTIVCQEGDTIQVSLSNTLNTTVAFKVGRTGVRHTVGAGQSKTFNFSAPAAGTYMYYDDQNSGVNRVMGLAGALVVMPSGSNNTVFPGSPSFVRQFKWMLHSVDMNWCNQVKNYGPARVNSINPNSFLPNYFTINGKSFPDTHSDHDTMLYGNYGDVTLIRMLNSGGMVNAPHFHGNHVTLITDNGTALPGSQRREKDVVPMFPLDVRDMLMPFEHPRDAWPPVQNHEEMEYPMHCHAEMSQTAGGGSYPLGMHVGIHMGHAPDHEPHL